MKTLTHARAVQRMIVITLMWSIAGVVMRQLESARGFEVTFWRSLASTATLVVILGVMRGPPGLIHGLRDGGRALWLSAACWAVMFTAFMLALTLTTVASVLVTMALAPLLTALVARIALGQRLARSTWTAIAVAGAGIAWMYGAEALRSDGRAFAGIAIALLVPIAMAVNWTLLQRLANRGETTKSGPDMLLAVLLGGLLSAAVAVAPAWPLSASVHDIGLLAFLGLVQLAIPCAMAVVVARTLAAPEIALLGLLEIVFGVAWAWLGAGEAPTRDTLIGGVMVLGALVGNELFILRTQGIRAPMMSD